MKEKRELAVPPDVETNGGTEILRLFVTNGTLSLSLQRGFAAPETWGQLLATLARHVSTVYDRETPFGAELALAEIRAALDANLGRVAPAPAVMH